MPHLKKPFFLTSFFVIVFLLLIVAKGCHCFRKRGLFVMTGGTKSHVNFFSSIAEALGRDGHTINFVTPYKHEFESGNVKLFQTENFFAKMIAGNFDMTARQMTVAMITHTAEICVKSFTDPIMKKLLEEEYDYVILSFYFTECYLADVYKRNIPLIYITPNALMPPSSSYVGAPEFASVTPNKFLSLTYPLSFWGRLLNTGLGTIGGFVMEAIIDRSVENLCRETGIWTSETPPLWDLRRQGSLAIINGVRALEMPIKSTPPAIIYAGGIHIKPTKPLSQDLEEWLNGSGETGFILFSLGTAVKPSLMKKEHLQVILNVFRTLDQRIIWKWDSQDIEDLPSNVKLSPWLPQQDILAHPKIRLFITHGGLLSTQEATYFGVPVIGMPVFGDQKANVAEIVAENWGQQIIWDELTEERLRNVIVNSLTNSSLREAVGRRSKLMKDWPTKPEDDVVYWTNYVLRHKGAKHLQSPLVHLTWYQIYNVDVWLFTLVILGSSLGLIILFIKMCLKLCLRKCFKRKLD